MKHLLLAAIAVFSFSSFASLDTTLQFVNNTQDGFGFTGSNPAQAASGEGLTVMAMTADVAGFLQTIPDGKMKTCQAQALMQSNGSGMFWSVFSVDTGSCK